MRVSAIIADPRRRRRSARRERAHIQAGLGEAGQGRDCARLHLFLSGRGVGTPQGTQSGRRSHIATPVGRGPGAAAVGKWWLLPVECYVFA
jgi:hypothetical protein